MSELQAGPSAPDNLDRVEEEGEGKGDSPEDAIDFEVGSLSSSERRTLGAVQKLTEAADKVLRSISKPLLQGSKFPFIWHLVNQRVNNFCFPSKCESVDIPGTFSQDPFAFFDQLESCHGSSPAKRGQGYRRSLV